MRRILPLLLLLVITAMGSGASVVDASDALDSAESNITAMEDAGLPTEQAEAIYQQAVRAFGDGEYNRTVELAHRIARLHRQGLLALDMIAAFNRTIQAYARDGIAVGEARAALADARQDLRDGRFQQAIETIEAARTDLEARRAERSFQRLFEDTAGVIERYQDEAVAGLIVLVLVGGVGYLLHRHRRTERRRKELQARETALEDLLKETQRSYYQDEAISRRVFELRSDLYTEKLETVRSELAALDDG